jgi:hypothetical protein
MTVANSMASPLIHKTKVGKDINLNVSLKGLLIRFGLTIFIPIVVLLINVHLVIYTAPMIAYLFMTTLTRFCVIKYLWHYYVLSEHTPITIAYGEDPNYPEQTI